MRDLSTSRLMHRLVGDIGPRWAGAESAGNLEAAEVIREELEGRGIGSRPHTSVSIESFPFAGWELVAEPQLSITKPEPREFPVALMEYSGLAPDTGLEGKIGPAGQAHIVPGFLDWPQYGLYDDDGYLLALFVGHEGLSGWDAPPIPLHNPEPAFAYPMAMLGQGDHRWIGEALARGVELRAKFTGGGRPTTLQGHNVVARLEGEDSETVVLTAHLDTSYGSPGANNNAGGVEVLAAVAEQLLAEAGDAPIRGKSVELVFCDGTEWQFLGSRHYLFRRGMKQDAAPILANINVDSVTTGDELFLVSSDEWMRERLEGVVKNLSLRDRFSSVNFLGAVAGSDHYSFIQAGIHATELLFWPCPTYKTSEDTMEGVDAARLRDAVEITRALIRSMEES